MSDNVAIRRWLCENGYTAVAEQIDAVMARWSSEGKRTRRNWWNVLAGGKGGRPVRIGGDVFPVLRAAQLRQNRPVTPNAVCLDITEEAPPIRRTNRWPDKRATNRTPDTTSPSIETEPAEGRRLGIGRRV